MLPCALGPRNLTGPAVRSLSFRVVTLSPGRPDVTPKSGKLLDNLSCNPHPSTPRSGYSDTRSRRPDQDALFHCFIHVTFIDLDMPGFSTLINDAEASRGGARVIEPLAQFTPDLEINYRQHQSRCSLLVPLHPVAYHSEMILRGFPCVRRWVP